MNSHSSMWCTHGQSPLENLCVITVVKKLHIKNIVEKDFHIKWKSYNKKTVSIIKGEKKLSFSNISPTILKLCVIFRKQHCFKNKKCCINMYLTISMLDT